MLVNLSRALVVLSYDLRAVMKFLEAAGRGGGFTLGCHVIGDCELLPPLSPSAIRCVREIWTGKWGGGGSGINPAPGM
jgi:hypothetical protein